MWLSEFQGYAVAVPPTVMPITLAEARAQLRTEDLDFDDDHVEALISAATSSIEKQYGIAILRQTIDDYHRAFPESSDTPMYLRVAPATELVEVEYENESGQTATVNISEDVRLSNINGWPVLVPKFGKSWPIASGATGSVRIRYLAGFGTTTDKVPDAIRHAIKVMVTDMYVNREDQARTMPTVVSNLLLPWYRHTV